MTPKELAFLVVGGPATLAALTIVAAGIIGAAIYKRLGVLAWCGIRALITTLGLAPILAPLTQTCP